MVTAVGVTNTVTYMFTILHFNKTEGMYTSAHTIHGRCLKVNMQTYLESGFNPPLQTTVQDQGMSQSAVDPGPSEGFERWGR